MLAFVASTRTSLFRQQKSALPSFVRKQLYSDCLAAELNATIRDLFMPNALNDRNLCLLVYNNPVPPLYYQSMNNNKADFSKRRYYGLCEAINSILLARGFCCARNAYREEHQQTDVHAVAVSSDKASAYTSQRSSSIGSEPESRSGTLLPGRVWAAADS